jgi:hypothetical protein
VLSAETSGSQALDVISVYLCRSVLEGIREGFPEGMCESFREGFPERLCGGRARSAAEVYSREAMRVVRVVG